MIALLSTLVALSGLAGLSWELVWQIEAGLALGVSARGTAITLAAVMGGMCLGAAAMGRYLRARPPRLALRWYAGLELVVALSGIAMLPGFRLIETIDGVLWRLTPALAPLLHVLAILLLLGPPTVAMGATLPIFGVLARRLGISIAWLYAVNTAGAAAGVLAASFIILPAAGISGCVALMVCADLVVALVAWLAAPRLAATGGASPTIAATPAGPGAPIGLTDRGKSRSCERAEARRGKILDVSDRGATKARDANPRFPDGSQTDWCSGRLPRGDLMLALATGVATFCLEVSWFRSLRATFQSTTDSFALMLVGVLAPLSAGAALAPLVLRRLGRRALPPLLAGAGLLVLLLTPLVERLDRILPLASHGYWAVMAAQLLASLALFGPPVLLLGICMPLLLAAHDQPHAQGSIYAVNTAGAIIGSLAAAWLLLPALGASPTAWLAGLLLLGSGALLAGRRGRVLVLGLAGLGLGGAVLGQSGVGRLRVQSQTVERQHRVLAAHEGPDTTVSVVEVTNGDRILVIDGFETTAETASAHYMAWMGRLPMLLHARPLAALVICFGTGQTAAAIKDEGAPSLDVVELDPAVLSVAPLFRTNRGVLDQPGVAVRVMDGRAWLRRTDRRYDVVSLEPMSPEFAGTNALYSVEFYRHMARVLNPGGIVAQWVPFHIVPPTAAVAITAAFTTVFPDALLWIDPRDRTGIVVGRRRGAATPLGSEWPGLSRTAAHRDLSPPEIRSAVWLPPAAVARYAALGPAVDDDNQALAYGRLPYHRLRLGRIAEANLALIRQVAGGDPSRHAE